MSAVLVTLVQRMRKPGGAGPPNAFPSPGLPRPRRHGGAARQHLGEPFWDSSSSAGPITIVCLVGERQPTGGLEEQLLTL